MWGNSLTDEQITAKNYRKFYDAIYPYLNTLPNKGVTPVGTVISVMGSHAPANYLLCDGNEYLIVDYPELANHFKTEFGSSNYFGGVGTSTFAVPTLSGQTDSVVCISSKNIYIDIFNNQKKFDYSIRRWLRFDPDNKKGLVIKAGTKIVLKNGGVVNFDKDTKIDLSDDVTEVGKDYFVFISNEKTFSAVTDKSTGTGAYIGRFHTLCVSAGTITMILPESPSSGITVSSMYLVKPYNLEKDPDFYYLYNKQVTAVSAGTPYDVITVQHPLSGFVAGDILPESVFCESFTPHTLVPDGMVYDKNTNLFVDVYLQSGTGTKTRSVYNASHTVSRQQPNHLRDMQAVGKRLLTDEEFFSIALGSNECTAIQGASDKTYVGGHVDTAGRRMISAIGCEECCGYLWQWLSDISPVGGSGWNGYDGRNSFGQNYGTIPYGLLAGGFWDNSSSCGTSSRDSGHPRSDVYGAIGARGAVGGGYAE